MTFDKTESLILAILAYAIGHWLIRRFDRLRAASIPEPILGGFVVALLLVIPEALGKPITLTLDLRDTLILAFFATVGLEAKFSRLREGGKTLLIVAGLALLIPPVQNLIGIGMATMLGEPATIGILTGSVSLSGGAGTAVAYAPRFEALGIENATGIGLAAAAIGLLVGSAAGGPIGRALMLRHGLKGRESQQSLFAVNERRQAEPVIDADSMMRSIGVIAVSIALAFNLDWLLEELGLDLPMFISAIVSGAVLTNVVPTVLPKLQWPAGRASLALASDICLNIFLAMSVIEISLIAVMRHADLLLLVILAQLLVLVVYVWFVVFRLTGKDYDAAVISSGMIGLLMGATPNAVACMTSITRRFGVSPRAMLSVPLVGLFGFDVVNALWIRAMLGWFG